MAIRLFVYGTLKRGQKSHHLLEGQEFLGEFHTVPRYCLFDAGPYPVLVEGQHAGYAIQGEVWRVDDAVLKTLDRWEEVPRLYTRRVIRLENFADSVWAYFYSGDVSGFPECGRKWPLDE